jgi:hypothetical protein
MQNRQRDSCCSRRCKELIAAAFDRSVDGGRASPLLNSRLHDFGFRCGDTSWARMTRLRGWLRSCCSICCRCGAAFVTKQLVVSMLTVVPLASVAGEHAPLGRLTARAALWVACTGSTVADAACHRVPFRGCTCVEQSVLGGVAHLLSFDGTGAQGFREAVSRLLRPPGFGSNSAGVCCTAKEHERSPLRSCW